MWLFALGAIEGADVALLWSSFRALEVDLGLTAATLGLLTFAQILGQSIFSPVWGLFADRTSRTPLLANGCLGWAVATGLMAITSNIHVIVLLCFFNGISQASLLPITQSLMADMSTPLERGKIFGKLNFFMYVGMFVTIVFATTISEQRIHGITGWRVAYLTVAGFSLWLSFEFRAQFREPERKSSQKMDLSVRSLFRGTKLEFYLTTPTFVILVFQGVCGAVSRRALDFSTMLFQYTGLSEFQVSLCLCSGILGLAFGSVLGGFVGDALENRYPCHGRALTAQLSVGMGIPLGVLLVSIQPGPNSFVSFLCVNACLGLTFSWCIVGVNRPLLSDLVSSSHRAVGFALLIAIECNVAAIGGPLVAKVMQHHGYVQSQLALSQMSAEMISGNLEAISSGLFHAILWPGTICFVFYAFLHITVRKDTAVSDIVQVDSPLEKTKFAATRHMPL